MNLLESPSVGLGQALSQMGFSQLGFIVELTMCASVPKHFCNFDAWFISVCFGGLGVVEVSAREQAESYEENLLLLFD
jgi:hypothetical protein